MSTPPDFLIADDHLVVRKGLTQILRDEFPDSPIREVASGSELLETLRDHKPSLLITDLNMPGKPPLEMIHQARLLLPGIPILVLSIHPEEVYALRVLKAGASGYLSKDSASDELIRAVRTLLKGKRFLSDNLADRLANKIGGKEESPTPLANLSDRELEVLQGIAQGKSLKEIASGLSVSINTVSTYRARLLEKLGFTTNAELVRFSDEQGIG
jgi:DNA-binding NarL/FixJ family response regulator